MSLTFGCQRYLIGVMARLRRAEQVEQNREAVLAAARRVFLDKGYAGATVDAIADELAGAEGVWELLRVGARDTVVEQEWVRLLVEFRALAARDPALNRRYADAHARAVEELASVLGRLHDRAGLQPAVAPPSMAEFIFAVRSGLTMEQLANPAALGLDEAIGLVYRALGFPEAPEPPSWLQAGPTAVDCRG